MGHPPSLCGDDNSKPSLHQLQPLTHGKHGADGSHPVHCAWPPAALEASTLHALCWLQLCWQALLLTSAVVVAIVIFFGTALSSLVASLGRRHGPLAA
eukprot:3578957-Prymnesium_polylepis.1